METTGHTPSRLPSDAVESRDSRARGAFGACGASAARDAATDAELRIALRLSEVNKRFYDEVSSSFSETRKAPWPGWERCMQIAVPQLYLDAGSFAAGGEFAKDSDRPLGFASGAKSISCLDLACGNMRFENFLAERFPGLQVEAAVVDSCLSLVAQARCKPDSFIESDIVSDLVSGDLGDKLPGNQDLVVCFGFMHHVFGDALRTMLLHLLFDRLAPGGVMCVSFWSFLSDARLSAKAQEMTPIASKALGLAGNELQAGDYFLGWQERSDVFRYCHSFTPTEVSSMAKRFEGEAKCYRFGADGRSGSLNEYLVLVRER